MKKLILIVAAVLFAGTTIAEEPKKKGKANCAANFLISGMKCEGCAVGLKFELDDLSAIVTSKINFDRKLASIAWNTNALSLVELQKTIKKLGYEAKLQTKKAPEPKGK